MTKLFSLLLISALTFANSAFCDELKGDAQAGSKKIAMCIGCHGIIGYQASFPEVHKVPMISGQNAKYIAAALTAYRKGERKHPTMKGIAASNLLTTISSPGPWSSSGCNKASRMS